MAVTIGTNLFARRVIRQLDQTTTSLGRAYERLSSGSRINRASDDAAGLSVVQTLGSKARILNRARANLSDGASLLTIADSGLSTVNDLLTRMQELAQQAANGTYALFQRRTMEQEYRQLEREIARIAATTKFNGLELLRGQASNRSATTIASNATINAMAISDDGRYSVYREGLNVRLRDNQSGEILVSNLANSAHVSAVIGATVLNSGDVFIQGMDSSNRYQVALYSKSSGQTKLLTNSLNTVAFLEGVTVSADGSTLAFRSYTDYTDGGTISSAVIAGTQRWFFLDVATGIIRRDNDNLFGAGALALSSDGSTAAQITGNILTISATAQGLGNRESRALSGSGTILGVTNTGQAIFTSTANLTGSNANNYTQFFSYTRGGGGISQLTNFTEEANIIGNISISPDATLIHFLGLNNLTGDNPAAGSQIYRLDLVTGEFTRRTSFDASFDSNFGGAHVRLSADGSRLITDNAASNQLRLTDITATDSNFDFEAGYGAAGRIVAMIQALDRSLSGFRANVLTSTSAARMALDAVGSSMSVVAAVRGQIGASMSRLGVAASLAESQREGAIAAESRIKDADIAFEAADLLRTSILQQTGAALLSQANQQPALALTLLRKI